MKLSKYWNFLFVILLVSCDIHSDQGKKFMTSAKGSLGEIILVMDTAEWKGALGDEIRETFDFYIPGLPRNEKMYDVHYVDPDKLNNVLKGARNMVFVTTLDRETPMTGFFKRESLEMIRSQPENFMINVKDEFAKDQNILHLFGDTREALIRNIRENREKIRTHFNQLERERLVDELIHSKGEDGIEKTLRNEYGVSMHVPKGFLIATSRKNFIWLRDIDNKVDRSIFITFRPYTSEAMFEADSLVKWRNETAGKYLFGDPEDENSYVTTEQKYANVNSRVVSFNNSYGVELRALWKTKNISMGGPFISYTFLDKATNRQYYIEAFIYSPGVDQRNIMKMLDAVLWTFRPLPAD